MGLASSGKKCKIYVNSAEPNYSVILFCVLFTLVHSHEHIHKKNPPQGTMWSIQKMPLRPSAHLHAAFPLHKESDEVYPSKRVSSCVKTT